MSEEERERMAETIAANQATGLRKLILTKNIRHALGHVRNAALDEAALTIGGWSTATNYLPEGMARHAGWLAKRDLEIAAAILALKEPT